MYLLFDIGGTKTRIALSKDGISFGEPVIVKTPPLYEDGIALFKKTAAELLAGNPVDAVAGGIAGPFSERKASLVGSPNLKDWIGKPFRQELEEFLGAPVHIENDAAMCGLGEAIHGAGRGFSIVAYITVSTGVGGVRIVDGRIDEKSISFEPGHQIIDISKSLLPDAPGPYFQDIVSGKSVEARTGKSPKDIADPEFWNGLARPVAYGLNNTVVHWSPDVVVLGGSMITGDPAIPVAEIEEHLKEILTIFPELPIIRKAELQDIGGLWGSLSYLQRAIRL